MHRNLFKIIILLLVSSTLIACSNSANPLNPDKPITISLWHYYNGLIKEEFDGLVAEFNETIGTEKGIIVETQSYGEITQLETALLEAANGSIGSSPVPDVFAAYSDHAYQMAQMINLVPLENYFSEDELATYREEFLMEGQFLHDTNSYILPIAKSTENLFVNQTDWERFAKEKGFTNDDLMTWEGIHNVAESYYEETGLSFFSHDSNANFMILFSRQLDTHLFSINDDGKGELILTEENAKEIWAQFYIPFMKGYYKKTGRFSPDDAKTGNVLAFTSSTAGAGYFPKEVTTDSAGTYPIEPLILPYPSTDPSHLYAVQQGAGMSITETDEAHEYGAAIFLKWFTEIEQNMKFSLKSGYLPVKKKVYEEDMLLDVLENYDIENKAIRDSLAVTNQMFKDYTLYSSQPFINSNRIREIVGNHLYTKVLTNLDKLNILIEAGQDPSEVLAEMTSDEEFHKWFVEFQTEIEKTLQ